MSQPFEMIITSGGTISKLDDVRHIGNFSRGTTGARIAEEFLRRGAAVHYVYGRQAKRPFRSQLRVDPSKPRAKELERVGKAYDEFQFHAPHLHEYAIETFEDYYKTVQRLLTETASDSIVLAAAVGDYSGVGQEGKISSDEDVLRVELPRNPKVISLVKEWNPRIFQVGFKLLSRAPLDELIDVAYQHGIKNHSNLTVANTLLDGDFKHRATFLITPEKGILPVSVEELPSKLADLVQQRVSRQHYKTMVETRADDPFEIAVEKVAFRETVRKFWKLNVFEPYFKDASQHFGFVAQRIPQGGFLITARGSDKQKMPLADIVYVPTVAGASRTVYVHSSGKKASLNANVAAQIFAERPEVSLILHAHVFPGFENRTAVDYAPGTQEDVDEVLKHLRNGERSVELINHGLISVGSHVEDIVRSLDIEPAYVRFPELYDALYHRFQQSSDFVDLVQRLVRPEEAVLDLAAGTGEVTWALLDHWYANISLADKSPGMLRVAREKVGNLPCYVTSLHELEIPAAFDAIVVRQAINYLLDYGALVAGLRKIYEHLHPGGRLIFNAPKYTGMEEYDDKSLQYEYGEYDVQVQEMNLVEGKMLTHTQRCTLLKKDGTEFRKVYDLNRFGLFTPEEFEQALQEAGFASVQFFGKGLQELTPESKTVYCVGVKT